MSPKVNPNAKLHRSLQTATPALLRAVRRYYLLTGRNEMTVREAGRLGGEKRKKSADYSAMGRKGGQVTKERYGMANYAAIGSKGGTTTAQRRGREFYQRIGRQGGNARPVRPAEAQE